MQTKVTKRGNTDTFVVEVLKDGVATDITGGTIVHAIKDRLSDSDEEARLLNTYTTFTDPTNGKHKISMSRSDLDLPPKTYHEEILYMSAAGITKTVLQRSRRIKEVGIDIDL